MAETTQVTKWLRGP